MKRIGQQSELLTQNDACSRLYSSILATLALEGYQYNRTEKRALKQYLQNKITKKKMEDIIDGIK